MAMIPRGFSLLELITVLALLSILSFMAVPVWQQWQQHQKTQYLTQQLLSTLSLARQQAIFTQQMIIVCPLSYPQDNTCTCGKNWNLGWITKNVAHQQCYDIFHLKTYSTLRWVNLHHDQQIRFLPNGLAEGSNGSFYYADCRLTVNRAGRARAEKLAA